MFSIKNFKGNKELKEPVLTSKEDTLYEKVITKLSNPEFYSAFSGYCEACIFASKDPKVSNLQRQVILVAEAVDDYLNGKYHIGLGQIQINKHLIAERKYETDIFLPDYSICIEVDGGHHEFKEEKDQEKDRIYHEHGYEEIIRFRPKDYGTWEDTTFIDIYQNRISDSEQKQIIRYLLEKFYEKHSTLIHTTNIYTEVSIIKKIKKEKNGSDAFALTKFEKKCLYDMFQTAISNIETMESMIAA